MSEPTKLLNPTERREAKLRMQLQCPLPKLDFDLITLGHGSGGLLTNQLLDSGVFKLLQNDWLDQRHDGAVLSLQGRMAFSTDSFVIHPIFFPGGNIGELAVHGTVNDLAMCGAIPKYLSLGFIIEEGLPMQEFWDILVAIRAAAEAAGVHIVTGDTKVVERGKGDKIFINTTGIGALHPRADIRASRIQPGDQIIVSGPIATHGMAIMSVREGLTFETTIESDTCDLSGTIRVLLDDFGSAIHLLRDPTRGGLATVLNELARDIKQGVQLEEETLPVAEAVQGACELLGLDPLYVANEGVFVAVVAAEAATAIRDRLRELPFGQSATIVGEVVTNHPGKLVIRSAIGGRRVVNMLVGDQLPRIC